MQSLGHVGPSPALPQAGLGKQGPAEGKQGSAGMLMQQPKGGNNTTDHLF